MSGREDDLKRALTRRSKSADYEVGYGKPPSRSRFEPGRSGNPKGRPKGSKNKTGGDLTGERLKEIILKEAYRTITVNDAKGPVKMPMAQAIVRALAVNAAKGQVRAQRHFTEMVTASERENQRIRDEFVQSVIDYKAHWEEELYERRRLGITDRPEPLPHPDHIDIDLHTGEVRFTGPINKEQKAVWDTLRAHKEECDETIAELEKLVSRKQGREDRETLLNRLEREKERRAKLLRFVPD